MVAKYFKEIAKQLRSGGWLDLLSWGEVSDIYLSADLLLPSHSPQLNTFQGFLHCFMKTQGTILSPHVPGTVWVISESPDVANNLADRIYQSQEAGKQPTFLCWWTYIVIKLLACFSSVQSLGRVQLFATPWTAARQASLSITSSWTLLKLMSFESVMPSNHLIRGHFESWVIFHCVYVPQLSYPFTCRWTSRLLPCPGCCKQCCSEHWATHVSFNSGFLSVYAQQWNCWVVWQFYSQFFKQFLHTVLHSGCTSLHS